MNMVYGERIRLTGNCSWCPHQRNQHTRLGSGCQLCICPEFAGNDSGGLVGDDLRLYRSNPLDPVQLQDGMYVVRDRTNHIALIAPHELESVEAFDAA